MNQLKYYLKHLFNNFLDIILFVYIFMDMLFVIRILIRLESANHVIFVDVINNLKIVSISSIIFENNMFIFSGWI